MKKSGKAAVCFPACWAEDGASGPAADLAVSSGRGGRAGSGSALRCVPGPAANLAKPDPAPGRCLLPCRVSDPVRLEPLCGKRPVPSVPAPRSSPGGGGLVLHPEPVFSAPVGPHPDPFAAIGRPVPVTVRENLRKSQNFLQKYLFIFKKMVYNVPRKITHRKNRGNRREAV